MSKTQSTSAGRKEPEGGAETTMQAQSSSERQKSSSGSEPKLKPSKTHYGEEAGECEFMIAADLTLYANPLRCLQQRTPNVRQEPATDHNNADEMIAADLVKYGSPLDDRPNK